MNSWPPFHEPSAIPILPVILNGLLFTILDYIALKRKNEIRNPKLHPISKKAFQVIPCGQHSLKDLVLALYATTTRANLNSPPSVKD